jgi:hypothetical protein
LPQSTGAEEDDYDDDDGGTGSKKTSMLPPQQIATVQRSKPLESSFSEACCVGDATAPELPVLVQCDDGEVILHFSELFAMPDDELHR